MARIRIYGKVLNKWYTDGVLEQEEIEYKEYDTESGELLADGTEDFSVHRFNTSVCERWLYLWDGEKRNKGGFRWFECKGWVRFRNIPLKDAKKFYKLKYGCELVDLRK